VGNPPVAFLLTLAFDLFLVVVPFTFLLLGFVLLSRLGAGGGIG
jgi:hypothetical protein